MVYRYLILKIIESSAVDMEAFREFAKNAITIMVNTITADSQGINYDPMAVKPDAGNPLTAYAVGKTVIDKRI